MSASYKGADFAKFNEHKAALLNGLTAVFHDILNDGRVKIGGGSFNYKKSSASRQEKAA